MNPEDDGFDGLSQLVQLASAASGIAFHHYGKATLARRARARAAELGLASHAEYVAHVASAPLEAHHLAEHFLLHTTEMFRDPSLFERLDQELLPALVRARALTGARRLRAWVAGCSTGEEAFSLAIALRLAGERAEPPMEVRVVASDVSASAIERAARGRVPCARATGVPDAIRARFLGPETDAHVHVSSEITDSITFCRHDLLDAARIAPAAAVVASFDVVSCRNVLIYLERSAQLAVLGRLLKACAPGGLLVLGTAEELPNALDDLAVPASGAAHIYIRTG